VKNSCALIQINPELLSVVSFPQPARNFMKIRNFHSNPIDRNQPLNKHTEPNQDILGGG